MRRPDIPFFLHLPYCNAGSRFLLSEKKKRRLLVGRQNPGNVNIDPSVAVSDVGGDFSIGPGGLGFVMEPSESVLHEG